METVLDKVTAFVTRAGPDGPDLLLFRHPNAGVQIPAGTVEPGEALEAAARREVREETGLVELRLVAYIGAQTNRLPDGTFAILETSTVYARPDTGSFDWARLRRGLQVRSERQQGDFVQVTYQEGNKYPDPDYTTYQITGWLPRRALAHATRRHFFHLVYGGEAAVASWEIYADRHTFRPFWAQLVSLQETPTPIVAPQQAWLDYVTRQLGYDFRRAL